MVQREQDEKTVGLTDMVLDTEPEDGRPKADKEGESGEPPAGEDELPLAGQ